MPSGALIKTLNAIGFSGVRTTKSAEAIAWCRERDIGSQSRKTLTLSDAESERIRQILEREHGHKGPLALIKTMSRSGASAYAHNEKTGSILVKHPVSLRTLPGKPLLLNGMNFIPAPGFRMSLPADAFTSCGHTTILVIENKETFYDLETIPFPLCEDGENPLVIWRGGLKNDRDETSGSVKAAYQVIRDLGRTRPVDVFPDADPAGLSIALSFGNLRTLRMPSESVLRSFETGMNRQDFEAQRKIYEDVLDAADHPDVKALWALLREKRFRVPQEAFHR